MYTDQPGVQFYTGGGLEGAGKNGLTYHKYGGLALEAQAYPDAVNQVGCLSGVTRNTQTN